MSRTVRAWLFLVSAAGVAAMLVLTFLVMPHFGSGYHPYRDLAIPAALAHATANAVSSVNLDQRGFDTLAEESILIASVLAVATLLREEEDTREEEGGRVLDSTLLMGWIMLPASVVIGLDVVAHGHLTPGGGFQGGVVLGTAIHLLYLAGRYPMLRRVRPVRAFEWGEAVGTAAYASIGLAGSLAAAAFLGNFLAYGSFGTLFSSGTVELLNGAVGVEVASGVIVVVSRFLVQALGPRPEESGEERGH